VEYKENEQNPIPEDRLIIGYDCSKEKDHTCLLVARKIGRGYFILNEFLDKEAEEIYKKLIGRKSK
jgi:hypothetical protein